MEVWVFFCNRLSFGCAEWRVTLSRETRMIRALVVPGPFIKITTAFYTELYIQQINTIWSNFEV